MGLVCHKCRKVCNIWYLTLSTTKGILLGMEQPIYRFRIAEALLNKIESQARKEQRTLASLIRFLIVRYLDEKKVVKPTN